MKLFLGAFMLTTFKYKKIGQRNGMLCRLMSVLPRESFNVIYKILILPLFDYALPVWGWTS